jgi:hypothetical protein
MENTYWKFTSGRWTNWNKQIAYGFSKSLAVINLERRTTINVVILMFTDFIKKMGA